MNLITTEGKRGTHSEPNHHQRTVCDKEYREDMRGVLFVHPKQRSLSIYGGVFYFSVPIQNWKRGHFEEEGEARL